MKLILTVIQTAISLSLFAQSIKYDSTIIESNLLVILDTSYNFQSAKHFVLDDDNSYLQVNGNYAVLSYRLRGKNEFISGKIYKTGDLEFNSNQYKTINFQGDNRFESSNQGKRFYIAIKKVKEGENLGEIILCTNTFTPLRFFKTHKASEKERKELINKSNSQNSISGF